MLSICNSFFCTMFFFASTGTRQIKPCLKMPLWYNWNVSLLLLRCCYTWLEYRTTLYYDDGGISSTTFCIHCITVLYCDLMVWVFCFGWLYLQLLIDHNYTPRNKVARSIMCLTGQSVCPSILQSVQLFCTLCPLSSYFVYLMHNLSLIMFIIVK